MKKLLLVAIMGIGFINLNAQNPLSNDSDPDHGYIYPDQVGISRPLREIWAEEQFNPEALTDLEKLGTESIDKKNNRRQAQEFPFSVENDGDQYGTDPALLQTTDGSRDGGSGLKVNFAGIGNGGMFPYDPTGAAGPNYYVQAVNATTYKVCNKTTGATITSGSVGSLWSPATPNNGDPIVMYDRFAGRWFISQFGSSGNKVYIAISTTGDPTGSYYTYTFTSPQFPDYLKFAIWHNGYYMTANTSTQRVYAFERDLMLTGGNARIVYQSFNPPRAGGFFTPMPGDADGTTLPSSGGCPIVSYEDNGWGGSFQDQINIYSALANWSATPTMSITTASGSPLNTAAFDGSYNSSWNDISQPGTTQKLDGIGGIIQYRAQYRVWSGYNSMVVCWPVRISATQRSIMWAELRETAGTWSIYQQGVYTPDSYYRWMGSISMDDQGNIALCYAKSGSSTVYPSLCYTGRLASDPLGQMTFAETVVQAGTAYQTSINRFGDYAQTTLDPDGITFWHTGMYLAGSSGTNAGRTRIYSFQLSSTLNAGVTIVSNDADNSICTGTSVTFTATPTNGGATPSYQWKVNGGNVGTNSPTYTTSALANGDIVTCVMTSSDVTVGNNPATSNAITMTVNPNVTPGVSIAQTVGSNPLCAGSTAVFSATPSNGGSSPSYQWQVNGGNVGNNSAGYSTTGLNNGDVVTVTMTSSAACPTTSTATSNSITMTVTPSVTPSVTAAATSTAICAGESVTYTATPANGGSTPSYQWKKNGGNVGTNSSTFTTTALANGDVITVVMTSSATCPSPTTATSNSITMTVTTVPTPTVTQNGAVLTSSAATGNQWYLDGNLLPGETGQSITVTQSGVYTVIVTVSGCSSNASTGLNATVGINEEENPYFLVVYPNPNEGEFNITFTAKGDENYTLNLYNELGQIVISEQIANHNGTYIMPVNLGKVATGIYSIVLSNGKQETIKKVIINN